MRSEKQKEIASMKLLHALLMLIAIGSTCKAHMISSSNLHNYTIKLKPGSTGTAMYDLDRGIVNYTTENGDVKRYNHIHMARITPAGATVFGTIHLAIHNELAGTWQLYKL